MGAELILGGARSGKSAYAERLARDSGKRVTVIATALPLDDEMAARIRIHRERRAPEWQTVEAPYDLATALKTAAAADRFVVIDCLTLWATNHLCPREPIDTVSPLPDWRVARDALLDSIPLAKGGVAIVSNEIGWGVIPMGAATRRFVDEVGWLNQALAARCDTVTLVAAGLPVRLKEQR
jgi:adenosylcobinamide kinase/adenosylcobinamide-phosphate guanylyltransferase